MSPDDHTTREQALRERIAELEGQLAREKEHSRTVSDGAAAAIRERHELRLQCQDLSKLCDQRTEELEEERADAELWRLTVVAQTEARDERYRAELRELAEELERRESEEHGLTRQPRRCPVCLEPSSAWKMLGLIRACPKCWGDDPALYPQVSFEAAGCSMVGDGDG